MTAAHIGDQLRHSWACARSSSHLDHAVRSASARCAYAMAATVTSTAAWDSPPVAVRASSLDATCQRTALDALRIDELAVTAYDPEARLHVVGKRPLSLPSPHSLFPVTREARDNR